MGCEENAGDIIGSVLQEDVGEFEIEISAEVELDVKFLSLFIKGIIVTGEVSEKSDGNTEAVDNDNDNECES